MKILCKTRNESRALKSGSSKNLRIDKLDKPTPEGFRWAVVLDNSPVKAAKKRA